MNPLTLILLMLALISFVFGAISVPVTVGERQLNWTDLGFAFCVAAVMSWLWK